MARLLVVEDDETIGEVLRSSLCQHGHDVQWARTGQAAVTEAQQAGWDLVLLDLGLPDLDGTEVCRELRAAQPSCVLVILTARTEEVDVVLGLEAGADDYLTKPLRLAELHARIRAHLRRESAGRGEQSVIELGALQIDPSGRRATVDGEELSLRTKEFELLLRLARDTDIAVSRETLMADVWDAHWFGSTKTLDVHVAAIRRKLADTGAHVPQIVTLRGHGYRLEFSDA